MQIVPFPAYYQSVYTNFDFTSFSLISWHGKRASVRPQKGIYCKSIGRLFKARRPCIGFELYENSLQTLSDMGISCL